MMDAKGEAKRDLRAKMRPRDWDAVEELIDTGYAENASQVTRKAISEALKRSRLERQKGRR